MRRIECGQWNFQFDSITGDRLIDELDRLAAGRGSRSTSRLGRRAGARVDVVAVLGQAVIAASNRFPRYGLTTIAS